MNPQRPMRPMPPLLPGRSTEVAVRNFMTLRSAGFSRQHSVRIAVAHARRPEQKPDIPTDRAITTQGFIRYYRSIQQAEGDHGLRMALYAARSVTQHDIQLSEAQKASLLDHYEIGRAHV